MEKDFAQITEELLRIIARDDELTEQFAKSLGISVEEFGDYLDRVEFPVVGEKDRHTV